MGHGPFSHMFEREFLPPVLMDEKESFYINNYHLMPSRTRGLDTVNSFNASLAEIFGPLGTISIPKILILIGHQCMIV